jgi:hypothetical protein
MLSWDDAGFVIEDGIPPLPWRTLSDGARDLVMSVTAELDEREQEGREASRPEPAPEPPPTPPPVPAAALVADETADEAIVVDESELAAPIPDEPAAPTPSGGTPRPARPAAPSGRHTPPVGVRRSPRDRAHASGPILASAIPRERRGFPVGVVAVASLVIAGGGLAFYLLQQRDAASTAPLAAAARPAPPPPSLPEDLGTDPGSPETPSDSEVASGEAAPVPTASAPTPQPPAATPTATPTPAETHGYLVAEVVPSASVVLDERKLGRTPLGRLRLEAGIHTIALSNDDVPGIIRDRIEIRGGETIRRRYSFAEVGYLQVVVRPWAEVFIDGRRVGQTPLARLQVAVGSHSVTLRNPQFGERTETIQVTAGETARLNVSLASPKSE